MKIFSSSSSSVEQLSSDRWQEDEISDGEDIDDEDNHSLLIVNNTQKKNKIKHPENSPKNRQAIYELLLKNSVQSELIRTALKSNFNLMRFIVSQEVMTYLVLDNFRKIIRRVREDPTAVKSIKIVERAQVAESDMLILRPIIKNLPATQDNIAKLSSIIDMLGDPSLKRELAATFLATFRKLFGNYLTADAQTAMPNGEPIDTSPGTVFMETSSSDIHQLLIFANTQEKDKNEPSENDKKNRRSIYELLLKNPSRSEPIQTALKSNFNLMRLIVSQEVMTCLVIDNLRKIIRRPRKNPTAIEFIERAHADLDEMLKLRSLIKKLPNTPDNIAKLSSIIDMLGDPSLNRKSAATFLETFRKLFGNDLTADAQTDMPNAESMGTSATSSICSISSPVPLPEVFMEASLSGASSTSNSKRARPQDEQSDLTERENTFDDSSLDRKGKRRREFYSLLRNPSSSASALVHFQLSSDFASLKEIVQFEVLQLVITILRREKSDKFRNQPQSEDFKRLETALNDMEGMKKKIKHLPYTPENIGKLNTIINMLSDPSLEGTLALSFIKKFRELFGSDLTSDPRIAPSINTFSPQAPLPSPSSRLLNAPLYYPLPVPRP